MWQAKVKVPSLNTVRKCFLWIWLEDRNISAKELIFFFVLREDNFCYLFYFLCLAANRQEGSYPDIVVVVEDSY